MSPSAKISPAFFAALVLAGLVMIQFLPAWAGGSTPFWGDLTYLHHPWRALSAQMLQAGRMPLWNPYPYFGMPLAAEMQAAVFYPGTLPFYFFDFATALALFHFFHYWLAGFLAFLWLRRSFPAAAALAGAVALLLGGGLMSRMSFLNHLAILSLAPAFFIFFTRPWLLALALSCAFLAGYPPFLIGSVVGAWLVQIAVAARAVGTPAAFWKTFRSWCGAAALSAALSGCLLLPAVELSRLSRRNSGMDLAETLRFGFGFSDLKQWVSPALVPWSAFNPAVEWWKCDYLGFAGWAAALIGFFCLARRKAAALLLLLCAVLVLILGEASPLSVALWSHAAPLRFIRYPGNLGYLAWPVLAVLVAAGARRVGWVFAALIALELSVYGFKSFPLAPRALFSSAGPLVRHLQRENGPTRYLISPRALETPVGVNEMDWKFRLYGLTNAPFRLAAAGNFGEPLVPKNSYAMMDFLYRQPRPDRIAWLLPWLGISRLLTAEPLPQPGTLRHEGRRLWEIYKTPGEAALAYGFDDAAGEKIPMGLPQAPQASGSPLALRQEREDRFFVEGDFAGWVFAAQPLYPGWTAVLETAAGSFPAPLVPALGAFQKVRVPAGPWRLSWRYDSLSWRLGLFATLAGILCFCLYWYNRARALARLG